MDVEKTIEFLLSNQAAHDERLGRLENIVANLENIVAKLAGSIESLVNTAESMAKNIERIDEVVLILAASGVKTNERIDKLVSAVGVLAQTRN